MAYNLLFSCNQYTRSGDLIASGVFLDLGNGVALEFKNPKELEEFAEKIQGMLPEIKETFPRNGGLQ
jgi:hypothetical protein